MNRQDAKKRQELRGQRVQIPAAGPSRDDDVPPARKRLARAHWQRLTRLSHKLLERLIQSDDRTPGIIGKRINFQHIFHVINELCRLLWWNAPHLSQVLICSLVNVMPLSQLPPLQNPHSRVAARHAGDSATLV